MTLTEIAETIRQAEKTKNACSPIRTFLKEKDIESAYRIQQINIEHKKAGGQQEVGKKIGLTSKKVQQQLGVNQPDFGILLHQMQIENNAEISFSELMQPKAEAEIAFILKEDLTQEKIDLENVISAIDYASPAIEIVGSRIENWNIQITDTIADNASASHFVLGNSKIKIENLDLENCKMQLFENDKKVSEGQGKACLGNPLNAVLWLAQQMKKLGNPLKKGEIILSGALGPMIPLSSGNKINAEIDGLGDVSFIVV